MRKALTKDPRLERVTKICRALPEASFELTGKNATYEVRTRTFAYYLNDHHGDGIIAVACKVLPGDNEALIAAHPKKFYLPAYVGPRGWVAMRLDIPGVDWNEVTALIRASYRLVAPQKLAYLVRA